MYLNFVQDQKYYRAACKWKNFRMNTKASG